MALQEIILEEDFEKIQAGFMRKHCHIFEAVEENKLEYMQIFQQYQNSISAYLDKVLFH